MTTTTRVCQYLNERFTYNINNDFDDQTFVSNQEVDLLRVNFEDGTKVRIFADLTNIEDGIPSFAYPEVIIFPKLPIGTNKIKVVQHLLRKHNLPTVSASYFK